MKQSLTLPGLLRGEPAPLSARAGLVLRLSLPAIFAELSSIAMQYIDAAMVGSLGAAATAAIGLMSSSTWLIGGLCIGLATGFSVQCAQLFGAGREGDARSVFRQSLWVLGLTACVIGACSAALSGVLPRLLGGSEEILRDASRYFLIWSCAIPFAQLRQLGASMLQSSGNMKTPGLLNAFICLLDVVYNFLLIFPSRAVTLMGITLSLPGAGLGVTGAALGTAFSEVTVCLLMLGNACLRSDKLRLSLGGSWRLKKQTLVSALKLGIPISLDHIFLCTAFVAGTVIVAPLGTTAVAANSLAVTAESLCYMPGYGIGSAATVVAGQSVGAARKDLSRSLGGLCIALGMLLMAAAGAVMYLIAPLAFAFLTTDTAVRALGTSVLRLELIAEPLYGASIVAGGVFRGAGDTLMPCIMTLGSMWVVRILPAAFLVPRLGLKGYWLAMCGELFFRGGIFLFRFFRGRWLKGSVV